MLKYVHKIDLQGKLFASFTPNVLQHFQWIKIYKSYTKFIALEMTTDKQKMRNPNGNKHAKQCV